ncbi:hypothetical protein DYB31_006923 [Aphanomyces astaci]|uniref:BSD domain-containing protein n=1 Tax=Aphanomyces astaci TaxID=112090 RepID=A0A397EAP8_APHAT|nr:hypothetical protein DYB31_006923 [Aphanomyces astaci]
MKRLTVRMPPHQMTMERPEVFKIDPRGTFIEGRSLRHPVVLGFFSFASQLGRQLTQDAMDLSTSAVETAKYLAVESTKVVEKASLMAQESLAEAFEASEETHLDMILDLPWVDAVKDGVFSISKTKANFHRLSLPTLEPIFDIDRFVQIAPALLALDDQLRQRHFELSYKLAEDVFWGNYFYHCHVLRVEHGLSPYMPIDGRVVPMAIPDTNQAADDDASALHVDEEEYGGVADDVADGRVEAAGPISTTQGDQKPPTTSAFSTMKSNLLHRSVQAKEKMQTIKRKIHFPSPDKIKDMQSSLLRRKSSVTESLERMSIPTMSSFKRSKFEEHSGSLPWSIFPRKRLDITYSDIMSAIASCFSLKETDRDTLATDLETVFDPQGRALACLSVRTGFDLFLQAMAFPKGSEIICSSITIPDMLKVIQHHGLVAVPVDLDENTLAMQMDVLERSNTKCILVAHVFGTLNNLDTVSAFAKAHHILLLEDCAQAYCGPAYTGHRATDVALFSFGTIKTSTAFGGGMLRVSDRAILRKMRSINNSYEPRSRKFFLHRLLKYSVLHSLTTPAMFGLFFHVVSKLGCIADEVITSQIRGFAGDLISGIRQRPSMPLLFLIRRKLTTFDMAYVAKRKTKSEELEQLLRGIPHTSVPGVLAKNHYYWLFPVLVPHPRHVAAAMIQDGFDVTAGATQLAFVPHPTDASFDPVISKKVMQSLVYLPVTAEMPRWALEKMAKSLAAAVASTPSKL